MLTFPNIDPVAINIGPIAVHWYGIMYLCAFAMALGLGNLRAKLNDLPWSRQQINDLIFYAALGVILGGKLGFILFYQVIPNFANFSDFNFWPIQVSLQDGIRGMSFHGGLIGVAIAVYLFAKKSHKTFFEVADFAAPLVPLGLAAGRIGNFINGELWGRPTEVAWGMIFPYAGDIPRHPSQLYEFFLEGILLFIIVWSYASKPRRPGSVGALFLMGYAVCRVIVEVFREPDQELGFIAFNWLTMGQILSIITFLAGLTIYIYSRKKYAHIS